MIKQLNAFRPALAGLVLAALFAATPAAAHDRQGHSMDYGHPACPGYGPHGMHPHGMPGNHCPHTYAKPYHGAAMAPGRTLGVMVAAVPHAELDELDLKYGVRVVKVLPGSPAETAGLQADDVILEFDGKPVFSGDRLRWLVRKGDEDRPVEIVLQRGNDVITLTATPATPAPKPKPKCEERPAPSSST